jgi:hypothetical protein
MTGKIKLVLVTSDMYFRVLSWNLSCVFHILIQVLLLFLGIASICQDRNTGCRPHRVFLQPVLIFAILFSILMFEEQQFHLLKLSSEYRRDDSFIFLQFSCIVHFGRETRGKWEGGVQEQQNATYGSRFGMYTCMCLLYVFCVMVLFPHF